MVYTKTVIHLSVGESGMRYKRVDFFMVTGQIFSLTLQMLSFNFHKSEAELFDEPITLEVRNKIYQTFIFYKEMPIS